MNIRNIHRGWLWGGLLAGALALSLCIYYGNGSSAKCERVLFFPVEQTGEVRGEVRILPRHLSQEKNLEIVVKDFLLGPLSMDYLSVVPRGTKLNSILLREGVVFMDLSADILLESMEPPLDLNRAVFLMERTVRRNFPAVKRIVVSIDGEVLDPVSRG